MVQKGFLILKKKKIQSEKLLCEEGEEALPGEFWTWGGTPAQSHPTTPQSREGLAGGDEGTASRRPWHLNWLTTPERIPQQQWASWLLCGNSLGLFVFTQSVCEHLEVVRHTDHRGAACRPRSSSGLEWSVFNPIKGKPNSRSIDFKFLSICFT